MIDLRTLTSGAFLALLALPAAAHDCIKPAAPFVTDRATLDFEQANAMTDEIDAFIAATNVYLACLERSDADARAEVERIIEMWEAPVDDLQIVQ
jgi:hypothetical protein